MDNPDKKPLVVKGKYCKCKVALNFKTLPENKITCQGCHHLYHLSCFKFINNNTTFVGK